MSKLIDRLVRTSETVSLPMGFRTIQRAPARSKMTLIARIEATADIAQLADYISSADAAIKKARTVDGEWPKTGQTLAQALAAAQEEDYATAIRLFKTIRLESEKSYQQVLAQREAAAKAAAEKAAQQKQAKPAAK